MLEILWHDISDVVIYIPNGVMVGLLWMLVHFGYTKYNGNPWRFRQALIQLLFACYVVVLIKTALLSREPGSRNGIDLRLFSTWGYTRQAHAYVIENIIMFLPFGFFLPFVHKKSTFLTSFGYGFFFSLCIETIQLLTKRGYFQVDDIVTNTLGALIGYLTGRLLTGILPGGSFDIRKGIASVVHRRSGGRKEL